MSALRPGLRRRLLLVGIALAIALGFLLGWYARIWGEETPESRARDAAEGLRDRIHELTH